MNTGDILLIAGIVVAAIAIATIIFYNITKYLMKVALDREVSKTIENRGKAKRMLTGVSEMEVWIKAAAEAAARLENSGCETVEISVSMERS